MSVCVLVVPFGLTMNNTLVPAALPSTIALVSASKLINVSDVLFNKSTAVVFSINSVYSVTPLSYVCPRGLINDPPVVLFTQTFFDEHSFNILDRL